jgi:hypothetical protein
MGVIINLPNNVTHYASINTNNIHIRKESHTNIVLGDYNESIEQVQWKYKITAGIWIWDDETYYTERAVNYAIGDTMVVVITDTVPTDIYTLIYNKYKSTLHSYTDDI